MVNGEVTMNELMDFLVENMATKEDLKEMRQEMRKMEHKILDTMDDKLSDLKGDLVVLMRKEDTKLCELVEILQNKDVITKEEAGKILGMQPFPQIS